ncbi:hypothetical protein LINPERPRIM_LOCUS42095 [Linum perenne]
MRRITSKL